MTEVLENLKYSFYSKYGMGDIVYLKTDDENKPRIITGIHFIPNGVNYRLTYQMGESYHFELEFSYEKNQFMGL